MNNKLINIKYKNIHTGKILTLKNIDIIKIGDKNMNIYEFDDGSRHNEDFKRKYWQLIEESSLN